MYIYSSNIGHYISVRATETLLKTLPSAVRHHSTREVPVCNLSVDDAAPSGETAKTIDDASPGVYKQVAAMVSTTDENGSWILASVVRYARITDKYYRKPGESKQYRSLLGIARAHYPEFIRGHAPSPALAAPVPPPPPPQLPTEPCAICLSNITEDACVLGCGHTFHATCLGEMADHVGNSARTRRSLGVTCPLCRKVTRAEVGPEEVTSQT